MSDFSHCRGTYRVPSAEDVGFFEEAARVCILRVSGTGDVALQPQALAHS